MLSHLGGILEEWGGSKENSLPNSFFFSHCHILLVAQVLVKIRLVAQIWVKILLVAQIWVKTLLVAQVSFERLLVAQFSLQGYS